MVIPDWSVSQKVRSPELHMTQGAAKSKWPLAKPSERMAAGILDLFVVLMPAFVLISAPLKRGLTASLIVGAESDFLLVSALMLALAIFTILFYQTFCIYRFGFTVGKRIIGLQVVSIFDDKQISAWNSFLRAGVWTLESLGLGLPWLSVFSNDLRRPLHDRLSDTIVIRSQARVGVGQPERWERSLVRGVYVIFILLFSLGGLIQIRALGEKMKIEHSLLSVANNNKDESECEIVSQNVESEHEHNRLNMAMTLYAAGLADRSCLESEVEKEVANQVPMGAITYLAQAFIYADEAEVSNSYLDKVCTEAPGSAECSMSQLVANWSNEDWSSVDSVLRSAPKGSGYLEIWGVRHYMKQAQYAAALKMLDELLSRREVMEFNVTQRVKALFNSYRETEAVAALKQAMVALPEDEGHDLESWVCSQQLQSSCTATESVACREVTKTDDRQIDFDNSTEALAKVLTRECERGASEVDYEKMASSTQDENWKTLFHANQLAQKSKNHAAAELYFRIAASESAPELIRVEAVRRLANSVTPAQAQDLIEIWNGFESKESWVKAGNFLFDRFALQRKQDSAYQVARPLMNFGSLSPKGMQLLSAMVEKPDRELRQPASAGRSIQLYKLLENAVKDRKE